jgi:hypothetical protein
MSTTSELYYRVLIIYPSVSIDDNDEENRLKIEAAINEMASQGYRFMFISSSMYYYFERISNKPVEKD